MRRATQPLVSGRARAMGSGKQCRQAGQEGPVADAAIKHDLPNRSSGLRGDPAPPV